MGPGKDVFGWPTGDVRLSVAWDGALARPRTGVAAGRVEPTGTVTEAWPVCSYAPSACHSSTCDGVDERARKEARAAWGRGRLNTGGNTGRPPCCCPVAFSASDSPDALRSV